MRALPRVYNVTLIRDILDAAVEGLRQMAQGHSGSDGSGSYAERVLATLPPIEIPPIEEPTPEELERRKVVIARILQRREDIRAESGTLDVATDELKHLAREESRW